jgi:Ankyrin repeat
MFSLFGMDLQEGPIIELPDDVVSTVFLQMNPACWPHIMRACTKFHQLFADGALLSCYIQKHFKQSIPEYLQNLPGKISAKYHYAILTQDHETLDQMHDNQETRYIRPTQNWLPGLYSEFQTCQDLTALFWACYHENVKEVGFMLEKIKTADLNGRSIKAQLIPLFINHNAFSLPSHSLAMFTLLKKHGFDFNQEIVPQGTPLMFAIRYNQLALVDYLVTVCGVNLNDCLQLKSTITKKLYFSSEKNEEPKWEKGRNYIITYPCFYLPIAYAVAHAGRDTYNEYLPMVQLLIDHNADPCLDTPKGGCSAYAELVDSFLVDTVKDKFQAALDSYQPLVKQEPRINSGDNCIVQ